MDATDSLIAEFRRSEPVYRALADSVAGLLTALVRERDLSVHSIACRVKSELSLRDKLGQAEAKYGSLSDVTDIVGIRVITYFADDVDSVAEIVEREFEIDRANSVDKRSLLDPDRFGYLSLHYVARLGPARRTLTEYKRFGNAPFEIQIRSILQHAWAEIEHDLGYKTKEAVPIAIRRRFARLAGILELADTEFSDIRTELSAYKETVRGQIEQAPASVAIDQASLHEFVLGNARIKEMDEQIARLVGAKEIEDQESLVGSLVEKLRFVGVSNIGDLERALNEAGGRPVAFARLWLERSHYKQIWKGISLFYLCYVLVAREESVAFATKYLEKSSISHATERPAIAERLIAVWRQVRGTSKATG